jgi:hypothetical protein
MNVIERDERGFSEDDYTELLDLMPDFSIPTMQTSPMNLSFRTTKSKLGNEEGRFSAC